jgi:osmotically-inducible protein OsmY
MVRSATVDADHVHVATNGTEVVLTGQVRSWLERSQAEKVAWSSPHVEHVDNRIVVVP